MRDERYIEARSGHVPYDGDLALLADRYGEEVAERLVQVRAEQAAATEPLPDEVFTDLLELMSRLTAHARYIEMPAAFVSAVKQAVADVVPIIRRMRSTAAVERRSIRATVCTAQPRTGRRTRRPRRREGSSRARRRGPPREDDDPDELIALVRERAETWQRDALACEEAVDALNFLIQHEDYRKPYFLGGQVRLLERLHSGRLELATSLWYADCLAAGHPEPDASERVNDAWILKADKHARRVAVLAAALVGTETDRATSLLPVYAGRELRHIADYDPLTGRRAKSDRTPRAIARGTFVETVLPGYALAARSERQDPASAAEDVESLQAVVEKEYALAHRIDRRHKQIESRNQDVESSVIHRLTAVEKLSKLAPLDRELVFMQAAGFSTSELAAALDLPDYVVRKRIERTRRRIGAPASHKEPQNVSSIEELDFPTTPPSNLGDVAA